MASLASEISGTQMVEFITRFGRFGGSKARLQELLGNDELMKRWVGQLDGQPEFRLVHGVFNPQDSVLAAFKARCAEKGIDFGKFTWVGSEQATDFDPDDPETVVVLDATLGTLQETFEFAWAWTVDGQEDKWRLDSLDSASEKLALLDGIEFKAWTLKWVRIKLDANVGKKPGAVRNAKTSPSCALLFMSAEHPERIKATDYEKRFGFYLPGLKCTVPGGDPGAGVPYVDFYRGHRRVELDASWCEFDYSTLAVPVLRE